MGGAGRVFCSAAQREHMTIRAPNGRFCWCLGQRSVVSFDAVIGGSMPALTKRGRREPSLPWVDRGMRLLLRCQAKTNGASFFDDMPDFENFTRIAADGRTIVTPRIPTSQGSQTAELGTSEARVFALAASTVARVPLTARCDARFGPAATSLYCAGRLKSLSSGPFVFRPSILAIYGCAATAPLCRKASIGCPATSVLTVRHPIRKRKIRHAYDIRPRNDKVAEACCRGLTTGHAGRRSTSLRGRSYRGSRRRAPGAISHRAWSRDDGEAAPVPYLPPATTSRHSRLAIANPRY